MLHEQCESGKDMMKLMSDLIAYLRDLLVFKVKPDALSDDVDPDLQKALAAQAKLIETDRLLELIDQFAEAEGRMKWAPNKKLHFEVALIKAIQTLSQVTLNEVIENLNALREGKQPPAVAGGADSGRSKSGIATAGRPKSVAERTDPGHSKPATAPAEPRHTKTAGVTAPGYSEDAAKIWEEVCAKVSPKGFLRTLVDSLTVVGTEGRNFVLGYPPEEKSAIETLATSSNRRHLENLLKEFSGSEWTLKLQAKEGLPARKNREPHASARSENLKHDPLIQEALEMFKGEIKS